MKVSIVLLASTIALGSAQTAPPCDVMKLMPLATSTDGVTCMKDVPDFNFAQGAITGTAPDAAAGTKICASTACKNLLSILKENGDCALPMGKPLTSLMGNVKCANIGPAPAPKNGTESTTAPHHDTETGEAHHHDTETGEAHRHGSGSSADSNIQEAIKEPSTSSKPQAHINPAKQSSSASFLTMSCGAIAAVVMTTFL